MLNLQAFPRQFKARRVRKDKKIPGIIYGFNIDPKLIYVDLKEFRNFINNYEAGLFKVKFENKELLAILKDVQYHPITKEIIHFDIFIPSLNEEVETNVPLEFVGVSPAVNKGGILNFNLEELPISTLPENIPEKIFVDLSRLTEIGQSIYVGDLDLDKKIKILISRDFPVVTVIGESPSESVSNLEQNVE